MDALVSVEPNSTIGVQPGQSDISGPDPNKNDFTLASTDYILNTNTYKFHYPDCSSVQEMGEKNKRTYTGSRDDIIAEGYVPCRICGP